MVIPNPVFIFYPYLQEQPALKSPMSSDSQRVAKLISLRDSSNSENNQIPKRFNLLLKTLESKAILCPWEQDAVSNLCLTVHGIGKPSAGRGLHSHCQNPRDPRLPNTHFMVQDTFLPRGSCVGHFWEGLSVFLHLAKLSSRSTRASATRQAAF